MTEEYEMRETLIISDLHGALSELKQLLDKVHYTPETHRLISVGDLTDRCDDSAGVVRFLRSLNAEVCSSNHDANHFAYYKAKLKGHKLPYRSSYKLSVFETLSDEDLVWLGSLPDKIHIKDNWYCIHGGCEQGVPFALQDPYKLQRTRWVDKDGIAVKSKTQQKGTRFWTEAWEQPYSIVYGHTFTEEVRIDKHNECTLIGIETGVCWGLKLTGFLFDRGEFVSVPACKEYSKRSE
jgi:calcineurin-like phosphoesterase family protein